ncbi:MAG: N-acetylglucosamine-6-phosphate deacetylase [Leptolinea sp.]|jgi:N-acetylglucosamine-6-phosphate deacetylase|nr:N-acetylglucosamine-6-phosphate deacetylase [Leptolinea sp.]
MNNTSNQILIHNAHIYGPTRDWYPGWLLTDGEKISLIGAGTPPDFPQEAITRKMDAGGRIVLPGFMDVHAHGAMGHEAMDASIDGLQSMAQFYAKHGVTSFLPTTWAASGEAIEKVVNVVTRIMGPVPNGATILGAHLEGPYLNPDRSGAQDIKLIRHADRSEAMKFLESGIVRLITLAPEFPENEWLIVECVRRGITASMGHTAADYDQVKKAVQLGVTHVTHTYNAMTGLSHREPGTVGAVITFPEIICELIADNIHVHPAAQKVLIRAKSPAGIILVTDCTRGTGMPEGEYPIDNRTITIKDGIARLPDGTIAGSILTMERALKNAMAAGGLTLSEAWPMSSLNAARNLGLSSQKGSIEVGKDADLVLLNDELDVQMTIAGGIVIFEK